MSIDKPGFFCLLVKNAQPLSALKINRFLWVILTSQTSSSVTFEIIKEFSIESQGLSHVVD
jgi:hypothetical protein